MKDLSGTIIDKIKQENIKPYPRWRFILSKGFVWGMFGLSTMLGSIGAAICLFQLRNSEWELYHHIGHSFTEFLLLSLPWFWLVVLVVLTGLAYYYFRKTATGYRYATAGVILMSLALSLAGGAGLSATPIPRYLETVFETNSGWYRNMNSHRYRVWMAPDKGYLAGAIQIVHSDGVIDIEDLDGRIWRVDVSETLWRGRLTPTKGLQIKLIGETTGERAFKAVEIRPWKGRRYLEGRSCGGDCTRHGDRKRGGGTERSCANEADTTKN